MSVSLPPSESATDVIQGQLIDQQQPQLEPMQTGYRYSDVLIRMRKEANTFRQQQLAQNSPQSTQSIVSQQTEIDLENPVEVHFGAQIDHNQAQINLEQRRLNQQLNQNNQENWYDFINIPSEKWPERKCNMIIHFLAAFLMFFNKDENCGIPLSFWLGGYLAILGMEKAANELRSRMSNSIYWHQTHRKLRKIITWSQSLILEIASQCWFFYGCKLYFSQDSSGCSKNNNTLMIGMLIFIILGMLKIFLFIVVVFVFCYILIMRKIQKRHERNMSNTVLNSLKRVKFSALLNQGEPDEECSICFMEYTDDDIVSRLDCNPKHLFHEQCLTQWISQGKNSCPICRAPINARV